MVAIPPAPYSMIGNQSRLGHTHPNLVQWTPDGTQILFDLHMRTYLTEVDGTRVQWIADGASDLLPLHEARLPAARMAADISPDGSRVAYATCEYTTTWSRSRFRSDEIEVLVGYEIATADLDGSNPQRLTHNRLFNHFPVWSPDGTRLAFLSGQFGVDVSLHTMNSDGTDIRRITDAVSLHPPVWSPDGSRIAFVDFERDEETYRGEHVIYTVAPDGSDLIRIGVATSGPTWSPDGYRLAFTNTIDEENAEVGLYVRSARSSSPRRLVATFRDRVGPGFLSLDTFGDEPGPWAPSWSPTGLHIAVGCSTMCVFNAYTGELVGKLTLAQGQGGLPAWSPDGSRLAVFTPDSPFVLSTMGPDTSDPRVLVRKAPGFGDSHGSLIAEQSSWKDRELNVASCSEGYVVPDPSANPGLVADCRALIEIRDDLHGDALTNWGLGTPIQQWQNVTVEEVCGPLQLPWGDACVELTSLIGFGILFHYGIGAGPKIVPREARVTELHGYFEGIIPPGIANLGQLRRLDLIIIRSRTPIPPQLGNITTLRELKLNGALSGPIPPHLGKLFRLRVLSLIGDLEGQIPRRLSALKQLRSLRLSYTQVTGDIPAELWTLPKLQTLHLDNNVLTGTIPPELAGLGQLQVLDLSDNQLTGRVPPELGRLRLLHTLSLEGNMLSGHLPPELGRLLLLHTLSLEGNMLSGRLPPELAGTNLERLTLPSSMEGCLPAELAVKGYNLDVRPYLYDDHPTCVADTYAFQVDESTPIGHLVGVLTLSGTEPVIYAIVSGNEHGHFTVDPETGKVTVAAPLDRNRIPSYVLLVEGTTSSGESLTATVSILLTSKLDLCSLGLAVPDPERNPGLVMDCAVLLAIGERLLEEVPSSQLSERSLIWPIIAPGAASSTGVPIRSSRSGMELALEDNRNVYERWISKQ